MNEQRTKKIPAKTERYVAVMDAAASRALFRANKGQDKPLITISDVFDAVCLVHPEAFGYLLGRKVPVPKAKPVECNESSQVICYSSEVDCYLSPFGGVISKMCESLAEEDVELDSLHIAAALLWEPTPEVLNLLSICGVPPEMTKTRVIVRLRREAEQNAAQQRKKTLGATFENVAKIRQYLLSRCFGQDDAVNAIVTQLSIVWGMPPAERGPKPLSFFFVGASGTGKNHLTTLLRDAFESILDIAKIPVIDFARYATEQMPIDLIGRDVAWKDGGHEGVLTGAAAANPQGVIVIENYERGHDCAVSYLDSILETGFAEDGYTKKNVCFSSNVFIVIV